MPVLEHKQRWDGDSNVIVATALRDHEIPVAYDLQGRPVTIESAEQPPTIPTLALVRAETDFSVVLGSVARGSSPNSAHNLADHVHQMCA